MGDHHLVIVVRQAQRPVREDVRDHLGSGGVTQRLAHHGPHRKVVHVKLVPVLIRNSKFEGFDNLLVFELQVTNIFFGNVSFEVQLQAAISQLITF